MTRYVVGVEDHYGWANFVSVSRTRGTDVVVDRRRVALMDARLTVHPYHHETLKMAPADAEALVRDVISAALRHANAALHAVVEDLGAARCAGMAIRSPPLPRLPASVAEAHANTWVLNRADGMIYHHALTHAAAARKLKVDHFDKKTVFQLLGESRGSSAREMELRVRAMGGELGPPWQKGHVLACAGALVMLGRRARKRS